MVGLFWFVGCWLGFSRCCFFFSAHFTARHSATLFPHVSLIAVTLPLSLLIISIFFFIVPIMDLIVSKTVGPNCTRTFPARMLYPHPLPCLHSVSFCPPRYPRSSLPSPISLITKNQGHSVLTLVVNLPQLLKRKGPRLLTGSEAIASR